MAWTAPRTWVNDEVPSQTEFNTHLRDNLKELWHEVAYVEFTGTVTSNASANVDVVSAGAVTFAGVQIIVEFYAPAVSTGSAGGRALLVQDGSDIGSLVPAGVTTNGGSRRLTPSGGSHTYKVQLFGTAGTPSTATAGAGGAASVVPGFIRIFERGG